MVEEGLLKGSVFNKVDINNSNDAMPLPEFNMLSMEMLRNYVQNMRVENYKKLSWIILQKTSMKFLCAIQLEIY